MVTTIDRARLHAGEVRACVRFGHRDGQDALTGHALRQKAMALLRVAEMLEVGPDQATVQRMIEADLAVDRVLLDHNLLEAEILHAQTAVLLIGPDQQIALLTHLAEHLAGHNAGFAPGFPIGQHFRLQELAVGIAE